MRHALISQQKILETDRTRQLWTQGLLGFFLYPALTNFNTCPYKKPDSASPINLFSIFDGKLIQLHQGYQSVRAAGSGD